MALITLNNWRVEQRLESLNLSLEPGHMLGVIGPNGAGKSSLLKSLIGELKGVGEATFEHHNLAQLSPSKRAQYIGYLAQSQGSTWRLSVEDVVSLGRLPWGDERREPIEAALAACDLVKWRKRPVSELSGGEQARVWLARVLAGTPQVLLADEPIASLDLLHQRRVLELLRSHAQGAQAVLVSIHDLSLAARYCDRLCLLAEGKLLAFGAPSEVLTPELLKQAFGLNVRVDLNAHPPIVQAL